MKTAHRPATTRSEGQRLGERFRQRLRTSSWCLTSTDSATTERAPPGPASRATVTSRCRNRTARSRTAESYQDGRAKNAHEFGIRHGHPCRLSVFPGSLFGIRMEYFFVPFECQIRPPTSWMARLGLRLGSVRRCCGHRRFPENDVGCLMPRCTNINVAANLALIGLACSGRPTARAAGWSGNNGPGLPCFAASSPCVCFCRCWGSWWRGANVLHWH